jgi:hypothetical protein
MARGLCNAILDVKPGLLLFQNLADSAPFDTEALCNLFLLLMRMVLLV